MCTPLLRYKQALHTATQQRVRQHVPALHQFLIPHDSIPAYAPPPLSLRNGEGMKKAWRNSQGISSGHRSVFEPAVLEKTGWAFLARGGG